MKRTILLSLSFAFLCCNVVGQTNVRGWYADGQVWVVWEETGDAPETYAIYSKSTPFTNTADATLIGRLFQQEWKPAALAQQIDSLATYRIPGETGSTYQLAENEGLFVFTPHQSGSRYFAVVKWGDTTVVAGDNITDGPVDFSFDPAGDPVECHLQKVFSPEPGYTTFAFYMWADGRQDQWDGRPDFPVMANAAKNGMPGFFIVSAPNGLDTVGGIPATIWLHGGGGTAVQSWPGRRPLVNLNPVEGILISHNDDLFGHKGSSGPGFGSVTWHFGWRKNYDPFTTDNFPTGVDTVVNYTQRRYRWIDDWLVRRFNVDENRININGHSMGSAGATGMAKAYPDHYASATIFNNGFGGPVDSNSMSVLWGVQSDNFPTNLVARGGQTVHVQSISNLTDRLSWQRDLPLIRSFHGKNDLNNAMQWDEYVVQQYRAADSLGWGSQLFWSERAHGIDTGDDYNDHWTHGENPDEQTVVDDVAYEEAHFRSDESFPAFFNHRLDPANNDPANNDPGDGTPGTGPNGSGDDWGTWGGYHRWDSVTVTYFWGPSWGANIWLEDDAVFGNDNCPVDSLTSNIAIRRIEPFGCNGCGASWPAFYYTYDLATGSHMQWGYPELIEEDSLIVLPDVVVYREGIHKLRIHFDIANPTTSTGATPFSATLLPNPVAGAAVVLVKTPRAGQYTISVSDASGRVHSFRHFMQAGDNRVPLDVNGLPAGLYFVQVRDENGHGLVLKMVKK